MNKKSPAEIAKMNVLIVGDSKTNLQLLEKSLKEIGFEDKRIIVAMDGQAAIKTIDLNIMADVNINLIITDYRMPKSDGLDLAIKIKADKRLDIPIIIASSEDSGKFIQKAICSGVIGFIQEPYSVANIKDIILSVLESKY